MNGLPSATPDASECLVCGRGIAAGEKPTVHQGPIPPGVPARMNPGSSWPRRTYHRECYLGVYRGLAELDESLNECAYFVRDGRGEWGWYERDGQRYHERPHQSWRLSDYPHRGGFAGGPFFETAAFGRWCIAHGLARETWWASRKAVRG